MLHTTSTALWRQEAGSGRMNCPCPACPPGTPLPLPLVPEQQGSCRTGPLNPLPFATPPQLPECIQVVIT